MTKIDNNELDEIIASYGCNGLIFDSFKQVEPDTALYFFHDNDYVRYCLIASDYLDDDIDLPCDFEYDYYLENTVKFRVVHIFSYIDNAKKKAEGYIDDNHYRTKASTGDVCMLFGVSDIKY